MDYKRSAIGLFIALACLTGCLKPDDLPDPDWTSRPAAIKLHCRADDMLNEYDGRAHTLLLVVYQLKKSDFFTKLAKDEDGLKRLLRFESVRERLAGTQKNVAACRRFIISPGQGNTISLDRRQGVKGIGIVAGYYFLNPGRANHFWKLPVKHKRKFPFFWDIDTSVGILSADLNLGPHELRISSESKERRSE